LAQAAAQQPGSRAGSLTSLWRQANPEAGGGRGAKYRCSQEFHDGLSTLDTSQENLKIILQMLYLVFSLNRLWRVRWLHAAGNRVAETPVFNA
jgi:hypothetical protein